MPVKLEKWQTELAPAPWRSDAGDIYDANDKPVAFMVTTKDEKYNVADALLIAQAPAMLDVCKKLVEWADIEYGGARGGTYKKAPLSPVYRAALDAINAAENMGE